MLAPYQQARVALRGSRPRHEVLQRFAEARGVMVPSRIPENSPLVVYEALACGTPVLCSSLGGAGELVEESGAGLLLRPEDLEAWEDGIKRLLEPDRFHAMSEQAYRFAESEFRISKCADAVEQVYADAAK